jgi:hypothetical protein
VDEDFLLGYASNAHGYRVFNNVIGLVEIAIYVTYDKYNGLQMQVSSDVTGNKAPPYEAIKKLDVGEVRPQEKDEDERRIWMTNEVVNGNTRVVGYQPSIQVNPLSHPTQ